MTHLLLHVFGTATTSTTASENPLVHTVGEIFHPIFLLFGWILVGIYAVIPNYAVAITGLTVLLMLALTPITIKSTRSMIQMQRLQPELKKLQTKYKGPENREQLNQEMMKLYRENGTSPFGACLPSLLQMPFLIILYSLIRGLSFGVTNKAGKVLKATPRYIPVHSKMYANLVSSHGQMHSIFGMDLSAIPFAHHGANQAVLTLPYLALIAIAVFFQYFQMKQMNSRNPQAAQANPQMQTMQKIFPLVFAVIYLRVPAGATIYMVVSSAMRIGTQEFMFRTGMVTPVTAEREISAGSSSSASPPAPKAKPKPAPKPVTRPAPVDGSKDAQPTPLPSKGGTGGNGSRNGNGKRPTGRQVNASDGASEAAPKPAVHPRSRSKRARKAR